MRFLAAIGVSLMTVEALRAAHHDAVHLRDEDLIRLPPCEDRGESRIVLTFDLDFGDIPATAGSGSPSVVIFRLRNQTPATVNPRLFRVIADCAQELAAGAIIIVEDERFRLPRLPIQIAEKPPSTDNPPPFTKLASSEARDNATVVIPSARPIFPRGIRDSNISLVSLSSRWESGLSICPGRA